jgi:hypothetical protein
MKNVKRPTLACLENRKAGLTLADLGKTGFAADELSKRHYTTLFLKCQVLREIIAPDLAYELSNDYAYCYSYHGFGRYYTLP